MLLQLWPSGLNCRRSVAFYFNNNNNNLCDPQIPVPCGGLNVIETNDLTHLLTIDNLFQKFTVFLSTSSTHAFWLHFRKLFDAGIEEFLRQLGQPCAHEPHLILGVEYFDLREHLWVVHTCGIRRVINPDFKWEWCSSTSHPIPILYRENYATRFARDSTITYLSCDLQSAPLYAVCFRHV